MREKINEILERTLEELKSANDSQSLDAVRVRVLGK